MYHFDFSWMARWPTVHCWDHCLGSSTLWISSWPARESMYTAREERDLLFSERFDRVTAMADAIQGYSQCRSTRQFSFRKLMAPRFSAAGMVRMKNHEKSGWVNLIWNSGQILTAGCGETPGRARTFISDQSKEVSQDRERRRKLHRCIQTAIDSARRDWSSARRDWRLFIQTFQPSFVISCTISTNEPSLESLKSQQSDGAIFVPVSPR